MNLAEAKSECQRWLDYLKRQEEKSIAMQQIAADRRDGKYDVHEARRRMRVLDGGVTVYDGARLADAVRFLMEQASWGN